ncbi:MAG: hypothetical protein QE279_01275 [Rhodoferax sp.]|nr:hypothetical protein [Rhodoferax sp.]
MNLHDLLFKPAKLKVGETRMVDGNLAICINPTSRFGDLWAIENRFAKFSTQYLSAYIYAICKRIDPLHGTVTMYVVRGRRDCEYTTGSTHVLALDTFSRYFISTDEELADMQRWMDEYAADGQVVTPCPVETAEEQLKARVRADAAQSQANLASVVGAQTYQWLEELTAAYSHLSGAVSNYHGNKTLTTRPAIAKSLKKLHKVLAKQPAQGQ